MTDQVIAAERLNPMLRPVLSALLDTMIPGNQALCMPNAGSAEVVDDVVATLTGDAVESTTALLQKLQTLDQGSFVELNADTRWQVFRELEATDGYAIRTLGGILLQCYYRSDAVLVALGTEARSPFPKGNEVPEGDWGLLDPVKNRSKLYREV